MYQIIDALNVVQKDILIKLLNTIKIKTNILSEKKIAYVIKRFDMTKTKLIV